MSRDLVLRFVVWLSVASLEDGIVMEESCECGSCDGLDLQLGTVLEVPKGAFL